MAEEHGTVSATSLKVKGLICLRPGQIMNGKPYKKNIIIYIYIIMRHLEFCFRLKYIDHTIFICLTVYEEKNFSINVDSELLFLQI